MRRQTLILGLLLVFTAPLVLEQWRLVARGVGSPNHSVKAHTA